MFDVMHDALRQLGELGWNAFQPINTRIPESQSVAPSWAPGPLPKSRERTRPPLGYPRQTDSLCPRCVIEVRNEIISGRRPLSDLVNGHNGEIRADILEDDG